MGTHISKVKSVDLDVWTVEQMNSIQKWGNKRANIYWEAHLKAGHIPPDHKMESFIRSKYESKRWAMEGPPPSDPSILEDGAAGAAPEPTPQPIPSPATSRPTHAATPSTGSARASVTSRQPQPHHLLSTSIAGRTVQATTTQTAAAAPAQQPAPAAAAPAQAASAANNDLFSLDFHNPTPPASNPPPKKDVKQDILSLFSTPAAAAPAAAPPAAFGQFGAVPAQANVWGGFASASPAAAPAVQANAFGAATWGAPQQNLWATPAAPAAQPAQQSLLNTNDIWASSSNTTAPAGGDMFGSTLPAKKDDVFGDIWGGFK